MAPITYAITEPLPDGLTFTADSRVLSGAPTTAQNATPYTYTATDSDPASVPVLISLNITINTNLALLPDLSVTSAAFADNVPGNVEFPGGNAVNTFRLTPSQSGLTMNVGVSNSGAAATNAMIQVFRSPDARSAGSPPTTPPGCGATNLSLCRAGQPRTVGAFAPGGATPQLSGTFTAPATTGIYHYFACFTDAAELSDNRTDNCSPTIRTRVGTQSITVRANTTSPQSAADVGDRVTSRTIIRNTGSGPFPFPGGLTVRMYQRAEGVPLLPFGTPDTSANTVGSMFNLAPNFDFSFAFNTSVGRGFRIPGVAGNYDYYGCVNARDDPSVGFCSAPFRVVVTPVLLPNVDLTFRGGRSNGVTATTSPDPLLPGTAGTYTLSVVPRNAGSAALPSGVPTQATITYYRDSNGDNEITSDDTPIGTASVISGGIAAMSDATAQNSGAITLAAADVVGGSFVVGACISSLSETVPLRNNNCASTTVFVPEATITDPDPATLTEADLNGGTLTVTLVGTTYETPLPEAAFRLILGNGITGITVASVARIDDTTATLTLAYDQASDGVTEDTTIAVTVAAAAHSGGADLSTTNTVAVTATPATTFDGVTIDPQIYLTDTAVNVTLPTATGGVLPVLYAITETLPTGLSFDSATRILSGTASAVQDATNYTYTATDALSVSADLIFTITVVLPPPDLVATSAAFAGNLPAFVETIGGEQVAVTTVAEGTTGLTLNVEVANVRGPAANALLRVFRSPNVRDARSLPTALICDTGNVLCAMGLPRTVGAFASGGTTPQVSNAFAVPETAGLYHYFACFTDTAEAIASDNCTPSIPVRVGTSEVTVTAAVPSAPLSTGIANTRVDATAQVQTTVAGLALPGGLRLSFYQRAAGAGLMPLGAADSETDFASTPGLPISDQTLTAEAANGDGFLVPSTPGDYDYYACVSAINDATIRHCSAAVTITVSNPVAFTGAAIAAQAYTVGAAVSITLPAVTDGNDPITYAIAETLPDGLTFTAADRFLGGTPTTAQAVTPYTYTATDGSTPATSIGQSFTILITGGALTYGGFTGGITEDASPNTVTGTLTATDAGGTTFGVVADDQVGTYGAFTIAANGNWEYTLDNADDDTNALPAGEERPDRFTVTIDGVAGATRRVTITVTGANDVPIASIVLPTDGTQVSFGDRIDVRGAFTDPDTALDVKTGVGDNRIISWSTDPPNTGSFDDTAALRTTWTVPASGTDPVDLIFTVTDSATPPGIGSARVTVHPSAAPIVIGITNIFDITGSVTEDDNAANTATGTLTVTNPNLGGSTDVLAPPETAIYGAFTIVPATGVWTYTLDNADDDTNALAAGDVRTETFTIRATADPGVFRVVTITITGANDAPEATISAPQANVMVPFARQITVTGAGADPDNANLTYEWSTMPANVGSFADPTAASTTWTAPSVARLVTLRLVVSDDDSPPATATAMVSVMVVPTVIIGDTTGGVTEDGDLTAGGDLNIENPPPGSDTTFLTANMNGDYGVFTVATNGNWSYTLDNANAAVQALAEDEALTDVFTVFTTLAIGGTTQDVTITVTGANDAPTAAISAPAADAEVEFGVAIPVTGSGADPDTTDILGYAWTTNPAGQGSFTDAALASTTWTPPGSDTAAESVALILTVTDDATPPATATAQVTVNPVGVAVTFGGTTTGGVTEEFSGTATGTLTLTTAATNKNVIRQTARLGAYGRFTINPNRRWTYTLDNDLAATNALPRNMKVTDVFTVAAAVNPDATVDVVITVTGTNDTPVGILTSPAEGTRVGFGGTLTLDISDSFDPDTGETETLRFMWTHPATGIADNRAAVTTWTAPASGTPGPVFVRYGLLDVHGNDFGGQFLARGFNVELVGETFVITGDQEGAVAEDGVQTATGTVLVTNQTDDSTPAFTAQQDSLGSYGRFSITTGGVWTYTLGGGAGNPGIDTAVNALAAGQEEMEVFNVSAGVDVPITITVTGANDAPTAAISAPAADADVEFGVAIPVTGSGDRPGYHRHPGLRVDDQSGGAGQLRRCGCRKHDVDRPRQRRRKCRPDPDRLR